MGFIILPPSAVDLLFLLPYWEVTLGCNSLAGITQLFLSPFHLIASWNPSSPLNFPALWIWWKCAGTFFHTKWVSLLLSAHVFIDDAMEYNKQSDRICNRFVRQLVDVIELAATLVPTRNCCNIWQNIQQTFHNCRIRTVQLLASGSLAANSVSKLLLNNVTPKIQLMTLEIEKNKKGRRIRIEISAGEEW